MPSGSLSCTTRLLADLDEVAEVVRDDVADDDRHHRVREQVRQRCGGSIPCSTPVAIVATAKVTPTTSAEQQQGDEVEPASELDGHRLGELQPLGGVLEAVERGAAEQHRDHRRPGPARTGTPSRLPSGLRSTSVPVAPVRPNTDRWPTSVEYTSNGSARSSQRAAEHRARRRPRSRCTPRTTAAPGRGTSSRGRRARATRTRAGRARRASSRPTAAA